MTRRAFSPSVQVYIDGHIISDNRLEVHTSHGLELPIATATVVLSLPRPVAVTFNKEIEIHAQIAENPARIFHGVIRADGDGFDDTGYTTTLNCVGWGHILAMPAIEDVAWDGPIDARQVIRAVLHTYGFGAIGSSDHPFHCPIIVNYDGSEVMLGGNPEVDSGQVRWKKGESGLDFINRICNLFGYYASDTPDGVFYIIRAIGAPPEPGLHVWNEGDDIITLDRSRDADPIANWIEAIGATPTPANGTTGVPYRSFPATVFSNPLIPTPGYKYFSVTDDLLVSDDMCESVRNIYEVKYNSHDPATMYQWTDIGHPRFRQGHVVSVVSDTIDVMQTVWLYSMAQDITVDGYWETFTGRADFGDPLPSGTDPCFDLALIDGPIHVGNNTIAEYDVPAPFGLSVYGDLTPTDVSSSLTLTMEVHSVNNHMLHGGSGIASKWVIEQPVGDELKSGPLPSMEENSGLAPVWDSIEIALPATLDASVPARLLLVAGDADDFEVRNVVLTICSEGTPILGGEPTPPTPPAIIPPPHVSVCFFSPPDVIAPPTRHYGSLTVPAGTEWIWIHGDAVGATGDVNPYLGTYSAQGYFFYGAGLYRYMLVPGTASEFDIDTAFLADYAVTGTILVGDGPFESFYRIGLGGSSDDLTITSYGLYATTGSPISVSNVCFEYLGPSDWPY